MKEWINLILILCLALTLTAFPQCYYHMLRGFDALKPPASQNHVPPTLLSHFCGILLLNWILLSLLLLYYLYNINFLILFYPPPRHIYICTCVQSLVSILIAILSHVQHCPEGSHSFLFIISFNFYYNIVTSCPYSSPLHIPFHIHLISFKLKKHSLWSFFSSLPHSLLKDHLLFSHRTQFYF